MACNAVPCRVSQNIVRRPPNSSDVARLAGVSRATVSYVFNGRRDGATVPEATRKRILAIAEEIGYRPNRTARALKTGRTHTIALWSASFATPYYASVLGDVQQHAKRDGYEVIVISGGETIDFGHIPADGVILLDKYLDRSSAASPLPTTMPIVSLGAYYDTICDHVGIDLHTGTRNAVEYLRGQGRQRIAYVFYEPAPRGAPFVAPDPGSDPRLLAYHKALEATGAAPRWVPVPQGGRGAVSREIRSFWKTTQDLLPDALLCLDDLIAVGALHALRELGVAVPGQVAVLGCDGIEEGEFQYPPLTTLVQPVAQASWLAWQFLRQRIENPGLPLQSAVMTPTLAIRGSA